ncbi:MAG: nucleotidyltransferase family protein [Clostridia bacterium]|nr:nucleotidyltransferase family protein [Clostridia bacterium]
MNILRTALQGEIYERPAHSPEEWRQIFQLAQLHTVLPLIYEAAYRSAAGAIESVPDMRLVRGQVRRQVLMQTFRTAEFLTLYKRLAAAGIRPLVLKGLTCRSLYPKPDQRPSGDEDILVHPDEVARCCAELEAFGMVSELNAEERADVYEIPYRKDGGALYIELHKHLFPPASEAYGDWNRFFRQVFDRAVVMEVQGVEIRTMAPTDNLFYLICHAFKHFMHSGFGIRQVCDIVLYVQKYGTAVRWPQFWQHCRKIRGEQFAAALLAIGEKYLGLDPVQAGCGDYRTHLQTDENLLLEDLLAGGLYGDATLSRKHSSNITLDAVAAGNKGKAPGASVLKSLFPPVQKLTHRYAYLKKHPYLVPFAWADRLLKYRKETKETEGSDAMEAIRIGSRRLELFRAYDIID